MMSTTTSTKRSAQRLDNNSELAKGLSIYSGSTRIKSDYLVFELKRDRASDVVVGQTLRYKGWVHEHLCKPDQTVNGYIIALARDEKLQYALKQTPKIRFMKYEVDFRLVA